MTHIFRALRGPALALIIACAWLNAPFAAGFATSDHVASLYTKREALVPMRDGVRLYTAIYIPRDSTRLYPVMMIRTPYSVAPYGPDAFPHFLGPSPLFMREGFIFVYQDVRGKYMSEGEFVDVRPQIDHKMGPKDVDESSDTYDTIEWLVRNVRGNNGRVGVWGISYPGFYAMAAALSGHPALKAASPQAPVCDWFVGDDVHHNGAMFLADEFLFDRGFGIPRVHPGPEPPRAPDLSTPDLYRFFLDMGPLRNANSIYLHNAIPFWNDVMQHGTYDAFWQARSLVRHVGKVGPAILMVGGWFDAEDLYGPLALAEKIRKDSPETPLTLVMGPWAHGGWSYASGESLGDVSFGGQTSAWFREHVELPFFVHYLKGGVDPSLPAMIAFETGGNAWMEYSSWPPANVDSLSLSVGPGGKLSLRAAPGSTGFDEYVSDPARPVPYSARFRQHRGVDYMVEDQRFAFSRPDVLSYETAVLTDTVTVAGAPLADLFFSTSGTDADLVVKLIDVYPDSTADPVPNPSGVCMAGYQQLVRGDVMRGKFRKSFSHPVPFVPGKVEEVRFALRDMHHAFLPGHRIMLQVQSSWFPLVDRNPQTFCDVYTSTEKDFVKATQRLYWGPGEQTRMLIPVLRNRKE
jgi:putative CocE/NonD family hydrolase